MTSDKGSAGRNMANDPGLRFVNDLNSAVDETVIVVRIPRGVRTKRALLAEFQRQLQLPQYFGWNWDALEDCLRDLTWLPAARPIVVLHDSLPLPRGRRNRPAYLHLMRDVAAFWRENGSRSFQIVFPASVRGQVQPLWDSAEPTDRGPDQASTADDES